MADPEYSPPVLKPATEPEPLEGQKLLRWLQQFFGGITLPVIALENVRPRWQAEPPVIPQAGTCWCAFGVTGSPFDTYPYVGRGVTESEAEELGQLQRHQDLQILGSFYDLGSGGEADGAAGLLRDGLAVPQNLEILQRVGMALVSVGDQFAVPSLLKERWLYRVDLAIVIRREVVRNYPVPHIESVEGTVTAEEGTAVLELALEVEQP